jgi:RNA polymerase sigma-70 factor (ECF subfamily)
LLGAARKGNHDAFKALVIKYESQVAATIIGMLGQCSEAEDVGQETFMRFYKSLQRFKGESSVGTYLIRIAINLSINELKRRQRRNRFFHISSEPGIEMESLPAEHSSSNPTPEQEEKKTFVHQALQKLEPRFRSVIVLRLIDGYSTKETAQILKLPTGTVLSRLARAQMKLKKILGPSLFLRERHQHGDPSLFYKQKTPAGSISPSKRLIEPLSQGVLMEGKNE